MDRVDPKPQESMNLKKTNGDKYPIDIVWAFLLFFACIMYAIFFHNDDFIFSLVSNSHQ